MEVDIIRALQQIRTGFGDWFFSFVTNAGDELFFIAIAVVLYWCIDKRFGFKLINVYLVGQVGIEGIKALVARPRPYTYEGVVSVTEKTSGFSFPSGHSYSISNLSTQVCNQYRKNYLFIVGGILSILVAFSRLYLGQHFISDVVVGLALGVGFAFGLSALFELLGDKEEYVILGILPIAIIVLIVMASTNSLDSAGNVLKVIGAYGAISIGYFIEKKYLNVSVKCEKWWQQIIKLVIGLAIVLIFKEGLKLILPQEIPLLYQLLRYFLVGIGASLGAPALFRLCKLEKKEGTETPEELVKAEE